MLKHLKITNYAIIEEVSLDFFEGMTVLTGETGAGKSIIVDAISLLLGDRASKEMISSKADTATVIGLFSLDNDSLKQVLKNNEIDYDNEIEILRTISKDNRNVVKINNQISSIKVLKDLAIHLADIHSQFDTNRLINPENYLALIDNFRKEKVSLYLNDYENALSEYKLAYKEYRQAEKEKENTLKQLDLYRFQYSELEKLGLVENEDETISEQINLLENMDKINTTLEKFNAVVSEDRLLETIYDLKMDLDKISSISSEFNEQSTRLNDIYYELEDVHQTLNHTLENLDYDQRDYDNLIERLHEIERFKRKYQKSVNELIEYARHLESILEKVDNYDEYLNERKEVVKQRFEALLGSALKLRQFRKDIALKITKEIKETLHDLVIKNADFEIVFEDALPMDEFDLNAFKPDGIDSIDFYISTNLGEPLKQLSKTASGGEMSRVMLAFKSIFVRTNKISTIIFDEIDTGISGYIAKQIANKIKEISRISQVISITHIPQVVATGIHHIAVKKEIIGKKTIISVNYLEYEERVEEIAKMISAGTITKSSIENAKELLLSE